MKEFYPALYSEFLKALRSKMLWGTMIFFAFVTIMMGFLMFVSKYPEIAGNSGVLSTKASLIGSADWPSFFNLSIQMALILGMLGPGIVTIWVFGREYSDRVIKDLLALPVSRQTIVYSKFIVIFAWGILLLSILLVFGVLSGFIVNLDGWTRVLFNKYLITFALSSLLTLLLCTPIAFITCASRGYLLPVGIVILLLMITQFLFVGLAGIAPYFPWAVPALCSGIAGPLSPKPEAISFIILGTTSLLGVAGTVAWWRFADQK